MGPVLKQTFQRAFFRLAKITFPKTLSICGEVIFIEQVSIQSWTTRKIIIWDKETNRLYGCLEYESKNGLTVKDLDEIKQGDQIIAEIYLKRHFHPLHPCETCVPPFSTQPILVSYHEVVNLRTLNVIDHETQNQKRSKHAFVD